jgi:hypothetical protein
MASKVLFRNESFNNCASSVLGGSNLIVDEDGAVELGYRVAEPVAGPGVATAGVRKLCEITTALRLAGQPQDPSQSGNVPRRW